MNKHIESLPKVDKSITFHYCTVICDIGLRPMTSFFWKDNILRFKFCSKWANLRLSVNVQKSVLASSSGGLRSAPMTPIIGASHLYLGGLQLSNAGTGQAFKSRLTVTQYQML